MSERHKRQLAETDSERLRAIVDSDALSVDLISGFAGDRVLTESESDTITYLREHRGSLFFSDILYAVTHQFFPPEQAETLWLEILRHKYELSEALHRNVQIIVATLDYLTSIRTGVHFPTLVNEDHIAQIVNMSIRDGLTGFFNHTTCFEIITMELNRFTRHGTAMCLILSDIDDFKLVNDEAGHPEGDRVLRELAARIKAATRDSDVCCRYGGEEFAIILSMTPLSEAAVIAERIREAAAGIQSGERTMTISSGVAACDTHITNAHMLVARADQALYEAKRDGKNRVVLG